MDYNIVIETEKNLCFLLKRFATNTRMEQGYQNPSETGMR